MYPLRRQRLGDADLRRRRAADRAAARPRAANGTLIARNSFDLPSIHRFDMRMQRRFDIGRAKVEGIVEVFNVFNHKNLNTFTTNLSSARYGEPSGDTNIDYQPRMMQFAFRICTNRIEGSHDAQVGRRCCHRCGVGGGFGRQGGRPGAAAS